MRSLPKPWRYVLGFGPLILALIGIVIGGAAAGHLLKAIGYVATVAGVFGLALAIGMLVNSYVTGVQVPALARQLTAMAKAMDDGQPVSGRFWAGLRDLVSEPPGSEEGTRPGSHVTLPRPSQKPPLTRWMSGRVVITPESVKWVRRMTGRPRDLTGAECSGERRLDPGYRESTLVVPRNYEGEILAVIALHANGTDWELVTQIQMIEILRYSLVRTPGVNGNGRDRLAGSAEAS